VLVTVAGKSEKKTMKTNLITVKQCSNPAEAAFFASYLEENGIHAVNSMETMGAWTGRYSLLSHGPALRVHVRDIKKARVLLASPPKPLEEDIEFTYDPVEVDFVSGESTYKMSAVRIGKYCCRIWKQFTCMALEFAILRFL
jgi:hypothetical protein